MKKKKTLLIDREKFIGWFFSDTDIVEDFVWDHSVLNSLKKTGKFQITADELLDGTGYIPGNVVAKGQKPILDENEEVVLDAYDKFKFA